MIAIFNYIKIGVFIIICSSIYYFIISYKNLEAKTVALESSVQTFEHAIDAQKHVIENLENDIELQKEIRNELSKKINNAEQHVNNLEKKLLKHNFAYIASKKPALLEKRINKGTQDVVDCFELLTKPDLNKNEIIKNCNDIIYE